GDGTDPGPDVRPDMPVEELVTLLNGPERAWPPGWEDWEVTHTAHRVAAERYMSGLPPYPAGRYGGRRDVVARSGPADFPSVYAALHAPFEEVLSLDADCYPVRDPSPLCDEPRYREAGAVFWPDPPYGAAPNWHAFRVPPTGRVAIETGQFVVNKRAAWRPLN